MKYLLPVLLVIILASCDNMSISENQVLSDEYQIKKGFYPQFIDAGNSLLVNYSKLNGNSLIQGVLLLDFDKSTMAKAWEVSLEEDYSFLTGMYVEDQFVYALTKDMNAACYSAQKGQLLSKYKADSWTAVDNYLIRSVNDTMIVTDVFEKREEWSLTDAHVLPVRSFHKTIFIKRNKTGETPKLAAVDVNSQNVVWEIPFPGKDFSLSRHQLIGDKLVVHIKEGIVAVDPVSGRILWTLNDFDIASEAVEDARFIYFSVLNDNMCSLVAVEKSTGKIQWQSHEKVWYEQRPAVYNENVFISDEGGENIFILNAADGTLKSKLSVKVGSDLWIKDKSLIYGKKSGGLYQVSLNNIKGL